MIRRGIALAGLAGLLALAAATASAKGHLQVRPTQVEGPARAPAARRQDAPQVMDVVGVAYAARPEFVLSVDSMWQGRVQTVEVPQERALDIDTEYDFRVASLLIGAGQQ